ncbi:MAG: dihydrofolate reductase [Candidatus Nanohaloarchaea archaeon]
MEGERLILKKTIIAAIDEENAIGKNGDIPWHYSEDLKHFRKLTTGNTVIMGRKTYFSLPEDFRPLPDRENIILTRSNPNLDESVKIVNSLNDAYEAAENEKLFIAGGASVYKQTLEDADKMILTRVPGKHNGDTFFPNWDEENWELESRREENELVFEEFTSKN